MWNSEPGFVHDLTAVDEEVEIDEPWSPPLNSYPPERPLDSEERIEELAGGQGRLDRDGSIQEERLIDNADGIGLAQRRNRDHGHALDGCQQPDRLLESPLAIAEIRSEADVGADH